MYYFCWRPPVQYVLRMCYVYMTATGDGGAFGIS